jgi:hypothetical protein
MKSQKSKSLRIMRIVSPGSHLHGKLTVEHKISDHEYDAKMIPGRPRTKKVYLRGMWYGKDPTDHKSFGKVKECGMIAVGKTSRHMPKWMINRI